MNQDVNHLWTMKHMDMAFARTEEKHINMIVRNKLWIDDEFGARQQKLEKRGITAVLSLGDPPPWSIPYPTVTGIIYHRIAIKDSDSSQIVEHFEEACKFIHENERVLVHCAAGVSRSATICIAYLMKHHGLSLNSAYMAVKCVRGIICPNLGFMKQLAEWELSHQ